MKKIKMLVNSIVNGSIGTQVVAGVVAVTVLGGAAFGGYKVYENLSGTKQERLNKNVESLKSKIVELREKASKLPNTDDVNALQAELSDLESFDIANNYDEAYDRYVDAEDKYNDLLGNFKAEMKALLEELEALDVSKFNESQVQEFEVAVQNYETVTNMEDFDGYKAMYEEAKKVYEKLASEENVEVSVESVNESSEEEVNSNEETVANNTTSSSTSNSGSTNTVSTSTNSGSTNKPSNSGSTNSGSTSSNSGSTNKPSNSGSTNSGSTNSGSTNSGSTNTGSTNSGSTNTTPSTPAPSTPQYETFNGFSYSLSSEGHDTTYVGGDNNYASMFSQLSSKSTVSSFVSEANRAVQVLTQGAYEDKVKAKFMNKVYNGKYLVTGVSISRYSVPVIDNGELVTNPYSYLVNQGVENLPGGLFTTVVGKYSLVSDDGIDRFVRIVIQFKEI